MTNLIAKKGGTALSTPTARIKPTDLNETYDSLYRKVYSDNTGASYSNSASEQDMATLTISQNDFGSSMSVKISGTVRQYTSYSGNVTLTSKLYVNGSAVKTVSVLVNSAGGPLFVPVTFDYLATGLDSTAGDIIIKMTAQSTISSSAVSAISNGLTVDAMENNA